MPYIEDNKLPMSSEIQYPYDTRLLEPGYAGELSPDEYRYIKSELQQSASLRRKWGFRPSAKKLSEKHVRAVARRGFFKKQRSVLTSAAASRG